MNIVKPIYYAAFGAAFLMQAAVAEQTPRGTKYDARIHWRGAQCQFNTLAAVQANACCMDDGFDGALRKHGFKKREDGSVKQ